MYIINPEANPKITKETNIAYKPIKGLKWKSKSSQLIQKKAKNKEGKRKKEQIER